MACASENLDDISLCSVCFDKFKTPRYLPCYHSFCHLCLSSFIASSCKSRETTFGFHCPVCREFTPCVGESESWVEHFPINEMLMKFLEDGVSVKFCGPCKMDDEEIEATDFCAECKENMCKTCTKYHRKFVATRNHTVCSLNEVNQISLRSHMYKTCRQHKDRPIELFCNDHDDPCCSLCAGTRHRKCDSVDSIEMVAENLRKKCSIKQLISEMESYEQNLSELRKLQEENIVDIDNVSDKLTEDAKKLEEDTVNHIRKLKDGYLDQLSKVVKESKKKINRNTDNVNDKSHCVKKCKQTLSDIDDRTDIVEQVVKFSTAKLIFQHLKKSLTRRVLFSLEMTSCPKLNNSKAKKLISFPKLQIKESIQEVLGDIDIKEAKTRVTAKFKVVGGCVYSGTFLVDGRIIFPQNSNSGNHFETQCLIFLKDGSFQKPISVPYRPACVKLDGEELYITCLYDKMIHVISSQTFESIREFSVQRACYGIDIMDDFLYIACHDFIEKLDKSGGIVHTYEFPGHKIECVIVTKQENVVYSVYNDDLVSAVSNEGDPIWIYKGPHLKFPYGLEKDLESNIYIAGRDSGNIHVLSSACVLIRRFENVTRPWFIAISPSNNIFCVCSDNKDMAIWQMY
ncbi:E3 ubiquitin-protein ligase TRIM45-like [Saccostrea echinata]|uniref:E3 ubiquitin-protein ligase TRIM45-like n=1 Tax=Saccostrea echinata TaxID=191078 RepID=UPI002A7F3752|nr:E3 ubiquitin-protein ligase TRIM45-like [Saccostrea echinata]